MSQSTPSGTALRLSVALTLAMSSVAAWLRGDRVADDRGSDSSEKAFMIILAIAIATAVSVAAVGFVAKKTALFK